MIKRIAALAFIFACTSIAWAILGTTIFSRTYSSASDDLKSGVASSWGTAQEQSPPTASYTREIVTTVDTKEGAKQIKTNQTVPLPVDATKVDVAFALAHRQKGLLWYSTYAVTFAGDYSFTSPSAGAQLVTFTFKFPSAQAIYDDLVMSVDGQPLSIQNASNCASGVIQVPAGKQFFCTSAIAPKGLTRGNTASVTASRRFVISRSQCTRISKPSRFPRDCVVANNEAGECERLGSRVDLQEPNLRL